MLRICNLIIYVYYLTIFFVSPNLSGQTAQEKIYIGEKVCRECHHLNGTRNQFNPWRLSKHANAYTSLSIPEAKQIAELSGIDVEPTESPICLGCHAAAYNVESWERDESFHLEDGIQCEQCHGPGSVYADEKIMWDPPKAKEAGLLMPSKRDCLVCHKEKNSHITVLNFKTFNYDSALVKISHSGKGGALDYRGKIINTSDGDRKYVGAFQCVSCHNKSDTGQIFSQWHQSKHAMAYVTLSSDRAKKIAAEMGVKESAQTSNLCLECHTTGNLKTGSFSNSFDIVQGVQCESCHGPANRHIELMSHTGQPITDHTQLGEVNEETCTSCHTKNIHGHTFDYNSMISQVNHSERQISSYQIEYKTPFNLAVTVDGKRLFIACEASNSLIVLDTRSGSVIAEIEIGAQPHFVCLSANDSRVYVSNRASDNVSVIDTRTYKILATIPVGDEPHEMLLTQDGKILYVANAGTYDVSVVDLEQKNEIKRLAASRGPWGAAISSDGQSVYISNNLPRYGKFRHTPESEITVLDTKNSTVKYRHTIKDANLIQGIAVAPDDEFVLMTLIRTKNLVPMTRNLQGWIMTNGIGILWPDGQIDQLLLDEVNDFFADPTDIVFSLDGKYAFVSGGGVQEIAMIDISKLKDILKNATDEERKNVFPNHLGMSLDYIVKRIPVGQSPRGMVLSPDNKYVYVADGLDDQISVIDIEKRKRVRVFDLEGPKDITQARCGERIFHSAQFTFDRQFSCHSCHPDGGIDGLTYDIEPDGLGFNPVDNRTLRGINDTAPFKWTGKNPTLKRQCGPRLAAFFTRIDPFTPEQSAALERYIVTIPRPPNRFRTGEELTAAQRRGKRIFERIVDNSGNVIETEKRCNYCHSYPYFTSREKFDVGTASWLDTHGIFDVPHLNNIYSSAPYLHDGRASSLEEIWTIYNPKDTHGLTNDLTKDQLNDLIEYLKTL
jgi:YVTN family beta-propeller protein